MSGAPPQAIALYLDAVCPYSYMMATAAVAATEGSSAVLCWHLVPIAGGGPGMTPADAAMHAARWDAAWPAVLSLARTYGLELSRPSWTADSRPATAIGARLADAPAEVARAFHLAVFDAHFRAGADIGDPRVVAALAEAAGASADIVQVTESDARAAADAAIARATALGITAVPALVTGRHLVMGPQPLEVVRRLIAHDAIRGPAPPSGVSLTGSPPPFAPETR